jgi:peptidoglycan/xylan/chitin deacetylase (PgdA/CDA1 family)
MVGFERERVQLELSRTSKLVEGLTGQPTHFFRPPFGAFDGDLVEALEETDHSLVLWNNVGGGDLDLSTPEMVLESTLSRAFPGAIIMLHATTPVTVEALPQLIAQLQARGLKLVTLNELLRAVETYESSK